MTSSSDNELERLTRENAYLKTRCATLQDDVTDLTSELGRLRESLEHRATAQRKIANPLAGGQ